MGGQMQQSNAAAAAATTALYDHAGAGGSGGSDAGSDAVMARWLQSAGLQHLASPLASTGIDHRLLPNLLMQVSNPHFSLAGVYVLAYSSLYVWMVVLITLSGVSIWRNKYITTWLRFWSFLSPILAFPIRVYDSLISLLLLLKNIMRIFAAH